MSFSCTKNAMRIIAKPLAVVMVIAALFSLAGCSSLQNSSSSATMTPSDYMVKLNVYTKELSKCMLDFAANVKDGDVASMQTKADAAYAVIDQMNAVDAPEGLGEIKNKYQDATSDLKSAMNSYIKLYQDADSAGTDVVNVPDYKQRLEEIQKLYDKAIGELEEADKKATEI